MGKVSSWIERIATDSLSIAIIVSCVKGVRLQLNLTTACSAVISGCMLSFCMGGNLMKFWNSEMLLSLTYYTFDDVYAIFLIILSPPPPPKLWSCDPS